MRGETQGKEISGKYRNTVFDMQPIPGAYSDRLSIPCLGTREDSRYDNFLFAACILCGEEPSLEPPPVQYQMDEDESDKQIGIVKMDEAEKRPAPQEESAEKLKGKGQKEEAVHGK